MVKNTIEENEEELVRINHEIKSMMDEKLNIEEEIQWLRSQRNRKILDPFIKIAFKSFPELRYAAMNVFGRVHFYKDIPIFENGVWRGDPVKIPNSEKYIQVLMVDDPSSKIELSRYFWESKSR